VASINGITVKAIKEFRGHEGEPLYQGNIYLGNKKIGFWSQDSWGGPDNICLDEPYRVVKLEDKVKELNRHKKETFAREDGSEYSIEYSLDILFGDLMEMIDDEKVFKKAIKNGYGGVLLVTDGCHTFGWNLSKETMESFNSLILARFSKAIEDGKKKHGFFKEGGFVKHETKIYRSLQQFNIGTHVKLEDIKGGK
jgi:hypothetical protein